ncbi:MAG: replication restart helicase PriA [Eubacterium sp.]|jgi:primosomal protein N' (replication factor Y)
MGYVKVIIDNNSRHTDAMFTYRAPEGVGVGSIVNVPFSAGNKQKRAWVMETMDVPDIDESKIKDVIEEDPALSITPEMVSTCVWMRQRYCIKYVDALRCFIPPGRPAKPGKEKRPVSRVEPEPQDIDALTEEQQKCLSEISGAVRRGENRIFLLHGVTGSGKTEVYMRAISDVLAKGKTAIVLVPEIALTKQITERLTGRFGKKIVAVMHSGLTGRERFDEWVRIRSGEAKIVVGARLAVFAPLKDIGLIVMDEEHESTYKSDMTPKYDTVDIAAKRLKYYGGVLILGSATPSVVSYERAREGVYTLLELKSRYNGVPLPEIETVDMRDELRSGNREILSRALKDGIGNALKEGSQSILFLNRRGYSTSISCRQCGYTLKCPECDITLTYHKYENAAVCHYCGKKYRVPDKCPECGSGMIKFAGVGTEQIEEYVKNAFPEANVARLDLDTARKGRGASKILKSFSKGETDILVGTQLVAKGLDFRNVSLVGVVSADNALNVPDYRASERAFQLITQVAGRAGRGDSRGRVIVQTYDPENFAIQAAVRGDYKGFFEKEIEFRRMMKYPPFTDLIVVEFTSSSEETALAQAGECMKYLLRAGISGNDTIFEPRRTERFKGSGGTNFRYNILIKSGKGRRNEYLYYLAYFVEKMTRSGVDCTAVVDVNPYSM